jgi:hypothetical protein
MEIYPNVKGFSTCTLLLDWLFNARLLHFDDTLYLIVVCCLLCEDLFLIKLFTFPSVCLNAPQFLII